MGSSERIDTFFNRTELDCEQKGAPKDATRTQQQLEDPTESRPTITLTWHSSKYKVHKLHQRMYLVVTHIMPGESFRRRLSVMSD